MERSSTVLLASVFDDLSGSVMLEEATPQFSTVVGGKSDPWIRCAPMSEVSDADVTLSTDSVALVELADSSDAAFPTRSKG